MKKIYGLLFLLVALLALPVVFAQRNDEETEPVVIEEPPPPEVDIVLRDLSERLGTTLTQDNVMDVRWERMDFPDTSLDCPQPDVIYPQVITPGYTIEIDYKDITYDYRISLDDGDSEDDEIIVLCYPSEEEIQLLLQGLPIAPTPISSPTPGVPQVQVTPTIQAVNPPNVAIAPASGAAGTVIDVRAVNFPPETLVVLGYGEDPNAYQFFANLVSNESGEVPAQFTLPDTVVPGTLLYIVIETTDRSAKVVSVPFLVTGPATGTPFFAPVTLTPTFIPSTPFVTPIQLQPTQTPFIITTTPEAPDADMSDGNIAIFPVQAAAGTSIQVMANDLSANQSLVVKLSGEIVRTVRTDKNGALFTAFTLPDHHNAGDALWVVLEDDASTPVAMTTLTVLADDAAQVTLSPIAGAPGETLELTATGFPANTGVLIGIGALNSIEFTYGLREITDAEGNLTMDITIPEDVLADRFYVVMVQVESDENFVVMSESFTPTGTLPTAVPDDADVARADVYLIAAGTANPNDIHAIGCNDLPVAVSVDFEVTDAPLTAVLTELLSLENRLYGRNGLYNALYQSELMIDAINVEDGVATINLSGSLMLDGLCDAARLDAQIRQTAVQFSTVDDVAILLNNRSLAERLPSGNGG